MKRIMIAALAILMLVAVSIGGVLPALAEGAHDHVHATVTADTVDAPAGVGATSTQPLGADLSGYKGTPKPVNARPIANTMDFMTMEADGTYYLVNNITLTRSYTETFTGKLYGMGKTVTISAPMFTYLDGAEIYDLTIEGSVEKESYAGALSEQAYVPRVTGVTNNASITSTTNGYTGGLIGAVWNKKGEVSFRYCVNNGAIDNASAASGKADAGGLVGIIRGNESASTTEHDVLIVEHCVNTAPIYGSNRIGGLIGVMGENAHFFGRIVVTNSTNTGDVTSTQHYAGGLTARVSGWNNLFENCLNTGDVLTVAESKYGGGIAGLAEDPGCVNTFRNCRNEGDVNMTNHAGGILGVANKVGTNFGPNGDVAPDVYFYDCVNIGAITSSANAGGIGGTFSSTRNTVFERCENLGAVLARDNAGGMTLQVVAVSLLIKDCYNGASVTAYNGTTAGDAGGMVGEGSGNNMQMTIENCINDGAITGGRPGGILGATDGKTIKCQIIDCVNNAKIHSVTNYGGGIAGRIDPRVASATVEGFESTAAVLFLRCVNNGEVEVFQSQTGGIVGYASGKEYTIEIRECVNNGFIHPTDLTKSVYVGGLGGQLDCKTEFYDSLNTGKVQGGNTSGGILAASHCVGVIRNCANTGEVIGGTDAGGILGNNDNQTTIESCVNTGNVTGARMVGGIAGRVGGTSGTNEVKECVNTGLVTNTGTKVTGKDHSTGGIVGYAWGGLHVTYCASLGDVVANYPATGFDTDGNYLSVGALCGYQNNSNGNYKNNYFTGTITANGNANTLILMAKQAPTWVVNNSDGKISNNFSVNDYSLYYHQATGGSGGNEEDPDTWEIVGTSTSIVADTSSEAFLSTLNTAAGAGTFVQVTTCEGVTFPIHKDTVAIFDLTRTHSDADHDYYTIMKKDATHHWYECEVCEAKDPTTVQEHTGGTANCVAPACCSVCDSAYGDVDVNNHLNEVVWTADANGHSTLTTCCERTIEEPHEFENGVCTVCEYECLHDPNHEDSTPANCQTPAYCGVCGTSYGTVEGHEYDTENWVSGVDGDANDKHYNPCKYCDAVDPASEQACDGGTATCTAAAVCTYCEKAYGDIALENHSSNDSYYAQDAADAMKCNLLHTCCHALIDTVDHQEGTAATCQSGAICANCEGEYGDNNYSNHVSTNVSYQVNANDATKHDTIHDCCGYPEAPAAHTGGTSTCKDPANCALCGASYGEPAGEHTYDDPCSDKYCNHCGDERIGMAHKFGEWKVTKAATDTEDGEQERVCEHCGQKSVVTIAAGTASDSALDSINTEAGGSDAYIGVIVVVVAGALVLALVIAFVVHKKNKKK